MKLRRTILSGAVAAATVLIPPAAAEAGTATGAYCVQDLAGGPKACFTTEPALEAYQAKLALSPLLTVFDATGWLGSGGYLNFVSAYGRDHCDAPKDKNEASEGNLGVRRFSTVNGRGRRHQLDMARCFGRAFDNSARSLAVT